MKTYTFLAVAALATTSSLSFGFDFSNIINWTGTGSNQAAVVIDFHDGTQYQSFAWGYRWDGSATGESMLNAIVATDPQLLTQIQSYSFGDALMGVEFNGASAGYGYHAWNGFNPGTNGFWDYYLGNGNAVPNWTESSVGFGGETLQNNDWNGWSWANNFNSIAPTDPIYAAPQSVPEPSELALLAISGLAFCGLKRRK